MSKKILSVLFVVAMMVVASVAFAAPGDIVRQNGGYNTFTFGAQPGFVIFKNANDQIAIWTPTAIAGDPADVADFYAIACGTTPPQAANSEWDAFLNGTVQFFSGSDVCTFLNNGGNVQSSFQVKEFNGMWCAVVKSVSITVYEEGEFDPLFRFFGTACGCDCTCSKPGGLFLNIHFGGAGLTEGTATTKTFSGIGHGGGTTTGNSNWFGYVRIMKLSENNTNTFDIVSGSKFTKVGEAVVSLEGDFIVLTITGIKAGAKDWKIWIGDEAPVAAADSKGALAVSGNDGKNLIVTGQYTVKIPTAYTVYQGNAKNNKVTWDFNLEDYLVPANCACICLCGDN